MGRKECAIDDAHREPEAGREHEPGTRAGPTSAHARGGGGSWPARVLACVDGGRWAHLALQHACRGLQPGDEVVLLSVCPRHEEGYRECGWMALEAAQQACRGLLRDFRVRVRLAVGDPHDAIPAVAREERADVVVMGQTPRRPRGKSPVRTSPSDLTVNPSVCPVLIGQPRGVELVAGEERLVVSARREVAASCEVPKEARSVGSVGICERVVVG